MMRNRPLGSLNENRPTSKTDWQTVLSSAIRDPATLRRRLGLPKNEGIDSIAERFGVLVPEPFLSRIRPGDPDDPLLRQVSPQMEENLVDPRFDPDPLNEAKTTTENGQLTKYKGRNLIVTSGACAVHCRFCFRRHFTHFRGEHEPHLASRLELALKQVATDQSIREIILSGGDPLSLTNDRLRDILSQSSQITHLHRIRLHTRFPIAIPQRVDEELVELLARCPKRVLIVFHINHPNELDNQVESAFDRLRRAGIPLLSQTVLLRGVNDRFETLAELFERLVDLGVIPYYLHQLDRVTGATHFEVPIAEGRKLIENLRRHLPGYAVPRYVQEEPGASSKTVLE